MNETIKMSNIISAEMQHEIDAIETARKWREWCKKKTPVTQTEEPDAFEAEMNMRIENIDKAINEGTPHKTYLEGEKSGFRYALAIYQELL